MDWPLRAALEHYRVKLCVMARADYEHRVLVWAVTAPYCTKNARRPVPEIPAILRGRPQDGET